MMEITSEQKTALEKVFDEMRNQRPPQNAQGGGSQRQSPEEMQKWIEEMQKRREDMRTKITQVLKPEQQEKFKSFSFQRTGGFDSPFINEQSLDVVNLTDEQKEKIRQITAARDAESRAAREKRDVPREDREKLRTEMRARYAEQIKAVLTAEQKAKAEKLISEAPALMEKLGLQRGGQGGQRGQNGQGGQRNREGGQNGQRGGGYRPGAGSWQPGQGTPDSSEPAPTRTFPREEQNTPPSNE
jgi:Spy/CpxP family protein refolding chaperone